MLTPDTPQFGSRSVVRVVPDVTGLDKQFDYSLPGQMRAAVSVGSIVRVPLHGRRVRGWVTALDPDLEVDPSRLQPVLGISSIGPDPALIDLAELGIDPLGRRSTTPISRRGKPAFQRDGAPVSGAWAFRDADDLDRKSGGRTSSTTVVVDCLHSRRPSRPSTPLSPPLSAVALSSSSRRWPAPRRWPRHLVGVACGWPSYRGSGRWPRRGSTS